MVERLSMLVSTTAQHAERTGVFRTVPLGEILERAKGIEPSYRAWEALVLPLNYARFEVRKAL